MNITFIKLGDLKVNDIIYRQANPYSFCREEVTNIQKYSEQVKVYIKHGNTQMFVLSGNENQLVMVERD